MKEQSNTPAATAKTVIAYVLVAKPGGGKGEFHHAIVRKLRSGSILVFTSDTGTLFRDAYDNVPGAPILNEYNRKLLKSKQDAGELQASAHSIMMVTQHFSAHYTGQQYIVMDGSPRRPEELYSLYQFLTEYIAATVHFIHIDVTDETAKRNMAERHKTVQRADTATPEKIELRLQEFYEKNFPVIKIIGSEFSKMCTRITNEETLGLFLEKAALLPGMPSFVEA